MTRGRILRIGVILLAAAILRFHGLADQGVFTYDEACHLIDAARLRADVSWVTAACWSMISNGALPPMGDEMYFGNLARPAHFAMMALLGGDTFSLLAMAAFGVASIFLVYKLGENIREGSSYLPEFAALLVALSPTHAFHSRTVLAETNALFFLLAAILYSPLAQSRRRQYILGAILGIAFTIQSRLTLIIPYLLVAEIIAHRSLGRIVSIAGGFLIPIVFFELFYDAINFVYWTAGTSVRIATYTDLYVTTMVDAGGVLRFNKPWFGLRYVAFAENFLTLVFFTGSALFCIRRRKSCFSSGNRRLIFWIGFGIWVIAVSSLLDQNKMPGYRYGRMVAPAIPAIALGAAFAMDALWRHSRLGRLLCAACLCLILFSRFELLEGIFSMKANHSRIFREVAARTQTAKIFSEEPYHICYYLGRDSYPAIFSPRSDSLTVIVFNEGYASNFPFYYILPDTPTFTLDGVYRTSRMGEFEEGHNGLDRFPAPSKPSLPVKVWVLGPESKPKIYKLF